MYFSGVASGSKEKHFASSAIDVPWHEAREGLREVKPEAYRVAIGDMLSDWSNTDLWDDPGGVGRGVGEGEGRGLKSRWGGLCIFLRPFRKILDLDTEGRECAKHAVCGSVRIV